MVFGLRSTSARLVIISEMYSPAPYSRHSRRKARLVMPASGASTTGGSTTIRSPNRSGGATEVDRGGASWLSATVTSAADQPLCQVAGHLVQRHPVLGHRVAFPDGDRLVVE